MCLSSLCFVTHQNPPTLSLLLATNHYLVTNQTTPTINVHHRSHTRIHHINHFGLWLVTGIEQTNKQQLLTFYFHINPPSLPPSGIFIFNTKKNNKSHFHGWRQNKYTCKGKIRQKGDIKVLFLLYLMGLKQNKVRCH